MTAPKLTAVSMITDSERPDWLEVVAVFEVTPAQRAAFASLLHVEDGVRVTVEAADAPVAAPRRPAEEIAREMVRVVESKSGGWSVAVRNSFLASHAWKATAAEDSGIIEAEFVRLIEQGRAEGAAAALAGQQPHDEPVRVYACNNVACADGPDVVKFGDRCNACGSELHPVDREEGASAALAGQRPRDLAGRIRALVQQKAGEWADADDGVSDEVLHDLVERLVQAATFARRGKPIDALIDDLRSSAKAMDAHIVGPTCLETLNQAADELTRIVRECEEKR